MDVLGKVFGFAHKNGIKYILFPGDLYDSQRMLPVKAVNATVSKLKRLFEKYPEIIVLAISGNHDHGTKNLYNAPAETALSHLSEMFPNFVLIDGGMCYPLEDGYGVVGVPYYEYPEHFAQRLKEASEFAAEQTDKIVLLMHQTPKGIANAFIPSDTDPSDALYDPFSLVLCGHIHARQQLTDKFHVVGSPLHRDREDEGQDKGFLVFDLTDNAFGFISLTRFYPTFITLPPGTEPPENAYVHWLPDSDVVAKNAEGEAAVSMFTATNSREQLVRNYWEQVDGKNKGLLDAGLSTLKLLTA